MVKHSFPDHNQNFWQLASIQGASQGLVAILVGEHLVRQHGPLVALASICVGNLLLWLIGLGVISMSAKNRQNFIQIVQDHLGRSGGLLVVLILISAFIFWYTIELQATTHALFSVLHLDFRSELMGLGLGVLVSILSIGGIRLIKWISLISLPLIYIFIFYKLICYGNFSLYGSWGISFSGVILVASLTLPGTINFPTFFRHSHSRSDSVLALTLTILYYIIFQLSSVFLIVDNPVEFITFGGGPLSIFLPCSFVLILFVCLNMVNIYFASAGLEILFPKFPVSIGYLLIGLVGSSVFLLLQEVAWVLMIENIVNCFIINLGVILILSYLCMFFSGSELLKTKRLINFICWLIGCVSIVVSQKFYSGDFNNLFLFGIWSTFISFIISMFAKQAVRAIKFIG